MLQTTEQKKAAKKLEKLISFQLSQKPVKEIKISIEWKHSRTWGANPHATAQVFHVDGSISNYFAKCSGWGYDKESTVIADIFNQCLAYKLHEVSNNSTPYAMYLKSDRKHFQGGVGVSCYYELVKYWGGVMEKMGWGKNFDVYNIKLK